MSPTKAKQDEATVEEAAAPEPAQDAAVGEAPAKPAVESDCVVDEPFHVGRAVNGKVCSYHAMHYYADGTKRE